MKEKHPAENEPVITSAGFIPPVFCLPEGGENRNNLPKSLSL
jgi:hypothetical protein